MDKDVKALTVRELIYRSNQLITCGESVDKDPLKKGMTHDEDLKIMMGDADSLALVARYRGEVIYRLTRFVEKKGLTKIFLAEDEKDRKQ